MTPATGTTAPPAPSPAGGRLVRGLITPVRFARQQPGRAALILGGLLLLAAAAAAGFTAVWFDHHLAVARREAERGHNATAVLHLDACHALGLPHRELFILSARVARRTGDWDAAEAALSRYSQRYGDDDALVFERLLLRATRGDVDAVGPSLLARVRAGGAEARLAREALVIGLLFHFRWADADRVLAGWLAADPDDATAFLLKGKLEEQRQQLEAAGRAFRRAVELDPEHDEARLRLTTLLVASRFGEEAMVHLAVLRGRLPDHPEVVFQWARALALQGRTAESRAAVDACLAARPDYPAALAERGGLALVDGDEAAAVRDLGRAARLDPGSVSIRSQYAFALARSGKIAEAAAQQVEIDRLKADGDRIAALIEGPLQSRPGDPGVPHEIAQIALRAGHVREALRWFEAALRVDPDHLPTHSVLAALHHELENPALAARHRAVAQQLSARQKH